MQLYEVEAQEFNFLLCALWTRTVRFMTHTYRVDQSPEL